MIVPCPVCKKEVQWKDNPYRPFCSDRCKLIDLGEWAMEKHAIPSDHADDVSSDKEKKQTINDEEED